MRYEEREVVAQLQRLTVRELRGWVREGWVRPRQGENGPVYDELDIARIQLVCDLKKEMSIGVDMLPVVLSLIDQLHAARRDFRCLAAAVADQPEPNQQAISEAFRKVRNANS
ncbi:MerR family transcriptional regulator [Pseudoruegeria sp. HB172150]|uniref:MerR family transcriptional regulator n=1 Tax=Pseudoruegeria sp. HB172150 TaxID=2721164 RepID=UPI001552A0CD|nr:MerR family transcriptional regulator [Pseudoruegeria sp. HB172150]